VVIQLGRCQRILEWFSGLGNAPKGLRRRFQPSGGIALGPNRYHNPGMADSVMGDPQRLRMWELLRSVANEGIANLRIWRVSDGLPHPQPTPAHLHTMPTLLLGLEGTTRIEGAHPLDLGPGEVLLIPPGCWHNHVGHRPGGMSFGLGFLAGRCDVLFFTHEQTLWGAVPEQPYRDLMERLLACESDAQRLPLIDEVLAGVIQDRVNFVDWIQPGVLEMAAFLWNNLHRPIHADEIVEHADVGRTQAYALFKRFFGRTPKQELLAQRLDLARYLLRTGLSVTETAERTGFPNRAELTRAYRRRFGMAPTADV
jgi:AraC-like DNA-binding protein